ncbi:hypothetical protein I7I53_03583 [Histoplasma capsulatum var. duboisii H88]|uniref:Uncharacterized protein n=1 Tax=Ajellomyces capsulatus (strain H88) TaxID=544711 RepID=A0A8A1LSV9_AJEC8|nr:hypothetical protein I7I53_03583 [Histoplasma capsulatum var. duboisii H88]
MRHAACDLRLTQFTIILTHNSKSVSHSPVHRRFMISILASPLADCRASGCGPTLPWAAVLSMLPVT